MVFYKNKILLIILLTVLGSCLRSNFRYDLDHPGYYDSCAIYKNAYRITILPQGDTFIHSVLAESYHYWKNLDGEHILYLDGRPALQYEQYNDLLNGEYILYHSNGRIKIIGSYYSGKRNGLFKFYYENGELKQVGHYYNDQKKCLWFYWNEDGSKSDTIDYGE